MKQHRFVAVLAGLLLGIVALPATARAQHSRPADTPSSGTAAPVSAPSPPPPPAQPSTTSSSGNGGSPRQFDSGGNTSGSGRRRGDLPRSGTAVARGSVPGNGGGSSAPRGGFYPWGYAYGAGAIAGYYGEYYGGYLGAYDPWYGWSPAYAPVAAYADAEGSIRLKVTPAEASVYVDGYYVGVVDDFDGAFQRLRVDAGPHRIEMRLAEHQTLSVDVMIQPDLAITYRGELRKGP